MRASERGVGERRAAGNPALVRLLVVHLATVIGEYAAVVAVLVVAYDLGGSRATGLVSIAVLVAGLGGSASAAGLVARHRPAQVRRLGLAAQVAGYALAAVGAAADLLPLVVVGAVVALAAVTTLRPTGAVLLPSVVRSSGELIVGNLWVARCEAVGALVGPLGVGVVAWRWGPTAAVAGCAVVAAIAAAASLDGPGPPPSGVERPLSAALATVRSNRATAGLLGVSVARYLILGALDVLLVVVAFESLHLGPGGSGLLNGLVGVGAVASTGLAALVIRRARLAPWLAGGLVLASVLCAALAASTSRPVAYAVLPLLGLLAALFDGLGRMLLQRSAEPRALAGLFALVELVGAAAMVVGSAVVQVLVAIGGARWALVGLAVLLALILVVVARPVWHADAGADLPVVEMSLLRPLPMFEALSPVALEALARTAIARTVAADEVVVRQGEPGERFFAVADGAFEVVMSGEHIRTARRGSFFGEVALLADVPRTATVTARGPGRLLGLDRVPFLEAVTGTDSSLAAAWGVVHALRLDTELPGTTAEAAGAG